MGKLNAFTKCLFCERSTDFAHYYVQDFEQVNVVWDG